MNIFICMLLSSKSLDLFHLANLKLDFHCWQPILTFPSLPIILSKSRNLTTFMSSEKRKPALSVAASTLLPPGVSLLWPVAESPSPLPHNGLPVSTVNVSFIHHYQRALRSFPALGHCMFCWEQRHIKISLGDALGFILRVRGARIVLKVLLQHESCGKDLCCLWMWLNRNTELSTQVHVRIHTHTQYSESRENGQKFRPVSMVVPCLRYTSFAICYHEWSWVKRAWFLCICYTCTRQELRQGTRLITQCFACSWSRLGPHHPRMSLIWEWSLQFFISYCIFRIRNFDLTWNKPLSPFLSLFDFSNIKHTCM